MIEEVKQIFRSGKVPEHLNKTLIALIPKIQGPETLGNYRPISLYNMVYKVVTKIRYCCNWMAFIGKKKCIGVNKRKIVLK